jgi:hypothetical protein
MRFAPGVVRETRYYFGVCHRLTIVEGAGTQQPSQGDFVTVATTKEDVAALRFAKKVRAVPY